MGLTVAGSPFQVFISHNRLVATPLDSTGYSNPVFIKQLFERQQQAGPERQCGQGRALRPRPRGLGRLRGWEGPGGRPTGDPDWGS